ncbi:hypothetical protein [Clostridium disporicum]|uniref:DUF5659 domain-containing protein n=1 Tax=Clostridium disporicum TaxID=84024 RepID=A0A174AGR8_9CLOT|nr:hypothetical protein [Clostridium disporicum]CUN87901.1 Uncharacterised protein [Clostridium disporicum]
MYFIYSRRIANILVRMGNELIGTRPNYKKQGFQIFVFKKTDKLISDLTIISQ